MNPEIIKIIITAVFLFVVYPVVRYILGKIVKNVAKFNLYDNSQAAMIKKTLNVIILFVLITILFSVWGVDKKNIFIALSSVFAVIGVALFAQWSILSNITAGLVIYFSLKLKIGDRIKIQDLTETVTITDIKTFYILLKTDNGEKIIYPNNIILQKAISVLN
jgi:small-conductance mechanosensitive channel